jgi:hypothetical protein
LSPSTVGVLRVSGRGIDDPHRAIGVADHIPYAAATGDLVLPLFEVTTVVAVGCEISTKAVLSFVVGPRTWLRAQGLKASACVRQR